LKIKVRFIYRSDFFLFIYKYYNQLFSFFFEYYMLKNEKIIKVQIAINDLGAIVHSGNKLRCSKFKVLEEIK